MTSTHAAFCSNRECQAPWEDESTACPHCGTRARTFRIEVATTARAVPSMVGHKSGERIGRDNIHVERSTQRCCSRSPNREW